MVLTGRLHIIPELYPISLILVPGVRHAFRGVCLANFV